MEPEWLSLWPLQGKFVHPGLKKTSKVASRAAQEPFQKNNEARSWDLWEGYLWAVGSRRKGRVGIAGKGPFYLGPYCVTGSQLPISFTPENSLPGFSFSLIPALQTCLSSIFLTPSYCQLTSLFWGCCLTCLFFLCGHHSLPTSVKTEKMF